MAKHSIWLTECSSQLKPTSKRQVTVVSWYPRRNQFQNLYMDTKIHRFSSILNEMTQYLHISYAPSSQILLYFFRLWWVFTDALVYFTCGKWELCAGVPLCGGVSQNIDSRNAGFSTCSMWVQKLGCRGLVTPWHVESLQTRDWTHVPCIGRWILNHWVTREFPPKYFKSPLIQWICYLNGCQCVATSSCAFWNFLEFFFSEHFLPMVGGTHWGRTHGCGEWVHCPWLTVNRINNTTKYIESSFFWIPCFFRELTPLFQQVLGWQDGGAHRISWWAGCGVLE